MTPRIAHLIRALYHGQKLTHLETWKKAGVATAALSAMLSALVGLAVSYGYLDGIPPELIMELSSVLVSVVMALLGYLQVATTEKIGLKQKAKDPKPTDPRGLWSDDQ